MLKRAYVEITNVCNLRCSFCPGTGREPRFMSYADFDRITAALAGSVSYLYFHVMGEPLLHKDLARFLALAAERGFRPCLTTNGTLLRERGEVLLSAPLLHKVSVSLHSFEGNGAAGDLTAYLSGVWDFAAAAAEKGVIVALRLWNSGGRDSRNAEITDFLREKTGLSVWQEKRKGSFTLAKNLYLENEACFDWPDLTAPPRGTEFCLALREQVAVLADGTVVPCCLDHEGDVPLGDLLTESLNDILASPRARALYDGFSRRVPSEELCRRCGFAARFSV